MEKFTEYAKIPALSAFLEWHTKEKAVSSSGVSHGLHVDISFKIMVARMILQNWRDRSLWMADRSCTPLFPDVTRDAVDLSSGNGTVQPSVVMYLLHTVYQEHTLMFPQHFANRLHSLELPLSQVPNKFPLISCTFPHRCVVMNPCAHSSKTAIPKFAVNNDFLLVE